MKVAFVNDFSIQLGVQSISSVLKSSGHQTKLFMDPLLFDDDVITLRRLNRRLDFKKFIIRQLKEYKPDIIGISVVTDFYYWACEIAQLIKQHMDVPIIFGGIHPSSVPERVIKKIFVDMICVGEGEYPMLELVNSMAKGEIDYSIKNIWFKKNGRVIKNEIRPLIKDLDSLPLLDKDIFFSVSPHYIRTYPYIIMTTRGCPHACSYCCHSYLKGLYKGKGDYLRQRSVKNVIQELSYSKAKYSIKNVVFLDDCFAHNKNWFKEFINEYKENIGLNYLCVMHPDDITREVLKLLKFSGCKGIFLGVQSWNEKIRSDLLKRNTPDYILKKAINMAQETGIDIMVDNIFDLPGLTSQDVLDSARIYSQLKPTRIYYYMLRYYPNTQITRRAYKEGWISLKRHEEILEGINAQSFAMGGDLVNEASVKYQLMFSLIDLIPKKISGFMVTKKIYKKFPRFFNAPLIMILRNILARDLNARLLRKSSFHRYFYFIFSKIRLELKYLFSNNWI
ncbi:MAG: B12-binding domain-containing radical SAM protein [Candidatus Omnitrophica bacterium]|nr:B12-binding domain-containing radical SAM protein [Candidatus Omnitrophota bacterium]